MLSVSVQPHEVGRHQTSHVISKKYSTQSTQNLSIDIKYCNMRAVTSEMCLISNQCHEVRVIYLQ